MPDEAIARRREQRVLGVVLASLAIALSVRLMSSRQYGPPLRLERTPQRALEHRIDLNEASAAELLHLPGIGPTLAQRIVNDRQERGRFPSVDALVRVKGIGPKTLDRVRAQLLPLDDDHSNSR